MSEIYEMLDSIQTLKAKRDAYDEQIKTLTGLLEKKMDLIGQEKAECGTAVAYWRKGTEVAVNDWVNVMEYVMKNSAFDILQRRISPEALQKRLDAGAYIPGVTLKPTKTFIVQSRKAK